MIYLDSAALVKMIRTEAETVELIGWLNAHSGEQLVASAIVDVEVPRALRRNEPGVPGAVAAVLARINRIEIDNAIRATAAAYGDPHLRGLDSIHLATADLLVAAGKTLTAFVTYDRRLTDTASRAGLPVAAPGQVPT